MTLKINSTSDVETGRIVGLVVGQSGIGKTSLVGTLEGRTLIASAEGGLLCIRKFPKEIKDRIDYVEIKSLKDFTEFCDLVSKDETKKKYQNLFIDSLTEIGETILKDLKKDPKLSDEKNGFKLYGKNNEIFTWFVKEMRDMPPYNVWFTCLNSYEKDGVELREVFNFPGSKGKENLKGWLDLVLKYEVFNSGEEKFRKLISDVEINPLAKDRSGVLEPYEDADLGAIARKILA